MSLFQFFDQPAGEALRFGDGEFAEFRSAACHRAAPESRTTHFESDRVELLRQRFSVERGHVHDEEVLHVGSAQFAAGVAFGEIGGGLHLFRRDSAAKCDRSHIRKTSLLLRVNADVVAIDVLGRMLFDRRIQAGIRCDLATHRGNGPQSIRDARKEISAGHVRDVRAKRRNRGKVPQCP